MTIVLDPNLERLVQDQIDLGKFASPEGVVEAGLHLLANGVESTNEVDQEILAGFAQLDSGQFETHDETSLKAFFDQVKTDGRKQMAGKSPA